MKHNYFIILLIFWVMTIIGPILNAQTTYIQVVSEPGISVFLDGVLKGKTTSEMGGLIIENVSPGSRTIKVVKEGFNPQEERIQVKRGEVYTYTVKPFVPKIKITEQGNVGQQQIDLQVGQIKIQSLPVAINISIPSLGVDASKSQDEWIASDIPVGEYSASFSWSNKTQRYKIKVKQNQLTHLFVNMLKGEIEDRSVQGISSSSSSGLNPNITYGEMRDSRDNHVYKTVKIGNQVWMAENLNYKTNSGSWCYDNNEVNCNKYGRLYDWETAKRVCPPGWHLPSKAEFKQLMSFVNNDGNSLKAVVQGKVEGAGTNTSGFSALLAGYWNYNGNFLSLNYYAYFWSSTENNATLAYNVSLDYSSSNIAFGSYGKDYGFSVRCLKD